LRHCFGHMKKSLFTLILLSFTPIILAQNFRQIGARQAGMSYAGVAINDVWAYHNNPGMLGFLEEAGVGAYYENRFFLREFQYQGLVYAQPLKKGVISFGGQYSGFEQFSTSRVGLGYALSLSEILSMGIQINYMNVRQPAYYGTKHGITGEFGLGIRVSPKWTMAMAINNLTRSKLVEYQNERFETIFRIGANYKVSERVLICSELEKDITFPMRLKAGVEYMPTSVIFIRAGAAVNVTSFSLGFGYKIKNLHIDISSNYLQPLGFQTCVSLNHVLKLKAE
jgi:hypothetical protein